jgi:nucleotide-binding universal stress UspA family protein
MTPYRHLLCPVDFSESSRYALEWSSKFSREVGARLSVLHVLDTEYLSIGNLVAPTALERLRSRAVEALAALKRECDLEYADMKIVEGVPEQVLVTAANEADVDLVVMGTHGLSGSQKFFLGSVTERVLHRAKVPVLVLSPRVRDSQTGAFQPPRTIVVAIDFGPESASVVRHGIWLKEHYKAKLVAVNVVSVPYVLVNEFGIEPVSAMQLHRIRESLVDESREELQALLPESTGTVIAVAVGWPFEALQEEVSHRSADLVLMGAGGHGNLGLRWLGSTCHKMVRWAPCPVMVVR